MKNFEIDSLGMQEMTVQETRSTEGGSLTVLIVCAAAALLLSSCNFQGDTNIEVTLFGKNQGNTTDVTVGVDAKNK